MHPVLRLPPVPPAREPGAFRLLRPLPPLPGVAPDRPLRFPLPADPGPLARLAARGLMDALESGEISPGFPVSSLHGPRGGKMFGVLVVRDPRGALGSLWAFSGQLERCWDVEGFVGPVFDREARARVEPEGEAVIRSLTAKLAQLQASAGWREGEAALARLRARHEEALEDLRRRQAERRALRASRRIELAGSGRRPPDAGATPSTLASGGEEGLGAAPPGAGGPLRSGAPGDVSAELAELDREGKADDVALRTLRARQRDEREVLRGPLDALEARRRSLEADRRRASQEASWRLYDTYAFEGPGGERRTLRDLFAPRTPSAGTGDCAAPRLLVAARRLGLEPLALAEFWWGAPPLGGGRTQGILVPPCREKCEPLLRFLLEPGD